MTTHAEEITRRNLLTEGTVRPCCTHNSLPAILVPSHLNPTVDIVLSSQAAVGIFFRMITLLAPVVPPSAAFVPTYFVSTAPSAAALGSFQRFVPFHRDPRRKALVFPNFRRYCKGDTRLVPSVAVKRPALPVATMALKA